uniref:Cadherin domain-containing protein n=1 Tax=Astyanax mexicanus TaxID=7994 RepID=A0A3B1JR52_ASTMX
RLSGLQGDQNRTLILATVDVNQFRQINMENTGLFARSFLFKVMCVLIMFLTANGDVSYSVPEEKKIGSVIGNLARDLGINVKTLTLRKARLDVDEGSNRYCDIDMNTGDLIVAERIDREQLCGPATTCTLKYEIIIEYPLELHRIVIEIIDINDNSPAFAKEMITVEISELAIKGARYAVNEAHDADIGINCVQSYKLKENPYFSFLFHNKPGQEKYELVLEKELDREEQKDIELLLTAFDGGNPQRSGTAVIHITVLDANDNSPVFSRPLAYVAENNKPGISICSVTARDPDWRQNGTVLYSLVSSEVNGIPVSSFLSVNGDTGVIHAVRSYNDNTLPAGGTLKLHQNDPFGASVITLNTTGDEEVRIA